MKLSILSFACALAFSGAASAQITETVTPLVPVSPADQQIYNVRAAEQQIQANEQAVALEKARQAQQAAKAKAAAESRQAKARAKAAAEKKARQETAEAEAKAKQLKAEQYQDEMRQIELESKRLDLEAKRSNVQTQIELNKVRQQQAVETLQKDAAEAKQ